MLMWRETADGSSCDGADQGVACFVCLTRPQSGPVWEWKAAVSCRKGARVGFVMDRGEEYSKEEAKGAVAAAVPGVLAALEALKGEAR